MFTTLSVAPVPCLRSVVRITLMLTLNEHIVVFKTTINCDLCNFLRSFLWLSPLRATNKSFELKNSRGADGAPQNSNYLLVIVPTFVMPYSITINRRMTPECTTQRFAWMHQGFSWQLHGKLHYIAKSLDALRRIEPCSYIASSTLIPNCSNSAS